MDFVVCLLSMKINPQQLAYLANLTMIVPITSLLLDSFLCALHATHYMMALLTKSMATTSETSKTEL